MKLIPLTEGQFAKVSDHRFEYLNQWSWQAWWNKETQSYYARRGGSHSKTYLMHREISNTPKGMICDHKNLDTLDNQDENLRNVTPAQSNMNRRLKSNKFGESHIRTMGNRFEVRIQVDGNRLEKRCTTLAEARQIRDTFIRNNHREFAYTGEPR